MTLIFTLYFINYINNEYKYYEINSYLITNHPHHIPSYHNLILGV